MSHKRLKEYLPQVLGDQIPCFRILWACLTVLFAIGMGICLFSNIPLSRIDSVILTLAVYGASVGLMCCFIQINHIFASDLKHYAALLKQVSEQLSHLLKLCRKSLAYFLAINPRKEIVFFGRLSDLLSLAERPYPNAPLAFRS